MSERKPWTLINLTDAELYEALMDLGFTVPFNDLDRQDQQLVLWTAQVRKDAD